MPHSRYLAALVAASVAAAALAQNQRWQEYGYSTILGFDGGIPRVYLVDTAGQLASIQSASGGLLITLDEKNLQALTDGCDTGELLHGITAVDQTVNASAVEVPLRPDGGRLANLPGLKRIFAQNNTTALAKDLRCSHDADGGDPAACTRGLLLTQNSGADFPVRFPERLSCICCAGGGATTGCTASATLLVCQ